MTTPTSGLDGVPILRAAADLDAQDTPLSDLSELLAAVDLTSKLKTVLTLLTQKAAQICDVDRCSIFLCRGHQLVPAMTRFAFGPPPRDLWRAFKALGPYRFGEIPALARAVKDRQPVLVNDPGGIAVPPEWVKTFGVRSFLLVPIVRGTRVLGLLQLDNYHRADELREEHIGLAQSLARHIAFILGSVMLLGETRNRLTKTEIVLRLGHIINSTLDLPEVARRIIREVARALGADSAGIYLQNGSSLQPLAGYHIPKRFLDALRNDHLVRTSAKPPRESVWSDDVPNDPAFGHEIFRRFPVQSVLVTPLHAVDERVGVLVCAWWTRRRRIKPAELRLIEGIATQAAMAIVNARLYARADETAVLRERTRMDSLMHDTLSRTLFSIGLKLEMCLQMLRRPSGLQTRLVAIKHDAALMMTQLRHLLVPSAADAEPVGTLLGDTRSLLEEFLERTGTTVDFIVRGDASRLDRRRQEVLLTIFAAGLAGIAERGPAGRPRLRLQVWADEVQFELVDDGADPLAGVERLIHPPTDPTLREPSERIQALGGRIEFWQKMPAGGRLWGTLPVA